MNIHQTLKDIRLNNNLTLDELADKLNKYDEINISKGTISRWENGTREPKNIYIAAYAKEFNLDLNALLGIYNGFNLTFSRNLKRLLNKTNKNQSELADYLGVSNQTITNYIKGYNAPRMDKVDKIANFFNVDRDELLSDIDLSTINGIIPIKKTRKIPILGTIACGSPIWAEENFDGFFVADENVTGDFVLRCQGDSMIDADIYDGDLVFLKKTPDVDSGKIAAVLIGDNATLKRVIKTEDKVFLQPANKDYPPIVLNEDMDVTILGEAVGVYHYIKDK